MKRNAIIAIVSLLAFGQGAWAHEPTIEGLTYNLGYYEIPDASALNALAAYVNEGNTCEGLTFKVTGNITFSQSESDAFVPIGYGDGYEGAPFAGTFDGQGYTISGIKYSDPEGTSIGLFGYISGALIQNVVIDDCSFTGNYEVGAIAGLGSGVHDHITHGIYNCIVGSSVTVQAVSTSIDSEDILGAFVGGIVGECANMTLSGCTCAATVTGDDCVGGIAGRLISSVKDGEERGVIENCFFTGTVSGTANKGAVAGTRGAIDGEEGTKGLLKLTLYNDDSDAVNNATRLSCYNGVEDVDVTLSGRTLYKDGKWNTLCLPFDVTVGCGLMEGATATTLNGSQSGFESETGVLTLYFDNVAQSSSIAAGTPIIVKWTDTDVSDPVFSGVKVSDATNNVDFTGGTFKGTYTNTKYTADNTGVIFLGTDNTLYYPQSDATISGFRSYFELSDAANVRSFVLNFGDETTGVGHTEITESTEKAGAWYTLDGRRLSYKPTQLGVYINNGKKIIIK